MQWDVAAAPGMGKGLRVPPVQGSALRGLQNFLQHFGQNPGVS